jgi:MarR family transcriptional regulator for hemolysin
MEKLEEVFFYSLESAIKSYRQLAQRNIAGAGLDITIDQWLIMKAVQENAKLKQHEIAGKVFKDAASVTRILDMLIQKKYITRETHNHDRRRTELKVSKLGKSMLEKVQVIINKNRAIALEGISAHKINDVRKVLSIISSNCKN